MSLEPVNIDFIFGGNSEPAGEKIVNSVDKIASAAKSSAGSFSEFEQSVRASLKTVDNLMSAHEFAIYDLRDAYKLLGYQAEEALKNSGDSKEYKEVLARQLAIEDEIKVRERLIEDLSLQSTALHEIEQQLGSQAQQHVTLSEKIATTELEMAKMEAAGMRGTDAYNKLNTELEGLKKQIDDVSGAMARMPEGKQFAEAQEKINSAIEKTVKTQKTSILTSDGATKGMGLASMASRIWQEANIRLAQSLGISATAAKALTTALTGGFALLIPIAAAVYVWGKKYIAQQKKIREEQAAAREEDTKYRAAGAIAAAEERTRLDLLYKATQNLNKPQKERVAAAKELKSLYPDYLSNLSEEQILAGKGAEAYTRLSNAILAAAKARAAQDKIVENQKKILENEAKAADLAMQKEEAERKLDAVSRTKYDALSQGQTQLQSHSLGSLQNQIQAFDKQITEINTESEKLDSANQKLADSISVGDMLFDPKSSASKKKTANKKAYDARKALQKQLLDLEKQTDDLLYAQREDSLQKRFDQIDREKAAELVKIAEQQTEVMAKYNEANKGKKGFTPATSVGDIDPELAAKIKAEIVALEAQFEAKKTKTSADYYKDLIASYKDFDQQRRDIDERYRKQYGYNAETGEFDEINKLKITEEAKQKLIAGLLKQRKAEYKDVAQAEADSVIKSSELMTTLFSNADKLSKKSTQEVLRRTKQLLDYMRGKTATIPVGFSEEDITKLKPAMNDIIATYSEIEASQTRWFDGMNYGFTELLSGYASIREAARLTAEAQQKGNEAVKNGLLAQAEAARQRGLQSVYNGLNSATGMATTLVDKLKELAEVTGDSQLSEFAGQASALVQNFSAAAQGAASGGWIGAIISGVSDMITQTVDAFVTKEAEAHEFEQNRLDFIAQYRMSMLELSDEFDNSWGNRGLAKVQDAAKKAEEALKQYNDYVNKTADSAPEYEETFNSLGAAIFGFGVAGFANFAGLGKTATNEWESAMEAYRKGYNELQSLQIKTTDHSDWANFWGKQDEYTSLKDLAPELWGADGLFDAKAAQQFLDTNTQISDEQRKQIQQAIDLKNAYDEAMAAIEEEIDSTFGYLGDEFTNALVDAIQNGTNAWENFRAAGSQAIADLGEQLAYELFMAAQMEAFKEGIKDIYTDTSMSSEDKVMASMQAMSDFFDASQQGIADAQDFMERYKEIAAQSGYDIWGSEAAKGIQGDVRNMTEDTGTALVGAINAMRLNVAEILATHRNSATDMTRIYVTLEAIRVNTAFCNRLDRIDLTLYDMKVNGIHLR